MIKTDINLIRVCSISYELCPSLPPFFNRVCVCYSVYLSVCLQGVQYDHCELVQTCSLRGTAPDLFKLVCLGKQAVGLRLRGLLVISWKHLFSLYTTLFIITQVNTGLQLGLVTVSLAAPVFGFVDHVFLHYLW